jgi:hypothetical protein
MKSSRALPAGFAAPIAGHKVEACGRTTAATMAADLIGYHFRKHRACENRFRFTVQQHLER